MSQSYQRTPDVTVSVVGSKRILYHPLEKKAVVLNATGSWVWGQLDPSATLVELSEQLQKNYPDSPAGQIRQDLEAYLLELVTHKVIRRIECTT